ncbi:MAG: fibronectin/fibrinogen-binding protein, partial [Clostridia bacterium]|nr:fibronectin/fibrinogen-binding protein [Clostridia bacterium]
MAFDGLVTKAIVSELQQLSGARMDKIYQPNQDTITLGCYFKGNNYAINISTHPKNYRINLTTHKKVNPQVAPNFCMVLRKHILGLRIKSFSTYSLERIITIEFEAFN